MAAAFLFAVATAAVVCVLLDRLGGEYASAVASGSRIASLDGLRGILAFSVAVHHARCWYSFTQTGAWSTGDSVIFARLASFGVTQFFYLSGYLFWRKLMRSGHIPMGRFYLSRFLRLGPVYYVCTGVAVLAGFWLTGFELRVSLAVLVRSLIP